MSWRKLCSFVRYFRSARFTTTQTVTRIRNRATKTAVGPPLMTPYTNKVTVKYNQDANQSTKIMGGKKTGRKTHRFVEDVHKKQANSYTVQIFLK